MGHPIALAFLADGSWWHVALDWLRANMGWWLALGMIGQTMFFSRFMLQWIASERAGKSIIPIEFWLLSIGGSVLLFAYAIHQREPVFALGYSVNSIVYIRNIMLLHKEKKAKQTT